MVQNSQLNVSIIVPTFERQQQTKKTLTLLYQSKGWNTEFIPEVILADSSTDDSIKSLTTEFINPNLLYVRPQKPGIAANKNAGAKTAKNELLIFCDSDMEVESDTLLNTLTYLKEHTSSAMVGGQVVWKGGEKDGQLDRPRKEDRMAIVENQQVRILSHPKLTGTVTLNLFQGLKGIPKQVRNDKKAVQYDSVTIYTEAIYSRYIATYRSLFWKVGGYDEEIFNMRGEGSDLSIRYYRSGLPLAFDEKIKVHHVHAAEASATRHMDHPERGIIRDLVQLGYKYGLYIKDQRSKIKDQKDNSKLEISNFSKTLRWLTEEFGEDDKYVIIESVIELLPYFWENKEKIEKSREKIPDIYDFKFLDVFTERDLFLDCIGKAEEKIKEARKKAFNL